MKTNGTWYRWQMTEPDKPFSLAREAPAGLQPGEAAIAVAGCGVCHTDLSFWHYGVKTRHPLPLTLGHEISGTVIDGPPEWKGKKVIVPAVLPCGECSFCKKGRSNICRNQRMPGNDFHGGFASHVVVPAKFLCAVPDEVADRYPLETLAVIADAVSTPYQVIRKSELEAGDLAIVVGVGGVGMYGAMIARLSGARVLALDINDDRLSIAREVGAEAVLNIRDLDPKAVKDSVRKLASDLGAPVFAWKIFEFSGTRAGQETAFSLLTYGSTLSVVGFTMEKAEIRLSNLMAFDAKMIGTWGCRAELYPEVLQLLADSRVDLSKLVKTFPLSQINTVFQDTLQHKYLRRPVLVPDLDNP